jgi:hypothetical protein
VTILGAFAVAGAAGIDGDAAVAVGEEGDDPGPDAAGGEPGVLEDEDRAATDVLVVHLEAVDRSIRHGSIPSPTTTVM